MVTLQQVQSGIVQYAKNDVMPHLEGGRRLAFGIAVELAANNIANTILKYKDHPFISMLNVMDENNEIDIDRVYAAASPMFENGQKHVIHLPFFGDMKVDRTDLESLYRYMKG